MSTEAKPTPMERTVAKIDAQFIASGRPFKVEHADREAYLALLAEHLGPNVLESYPNPTIVPPTEGGEYVVTFPTPGKQVGGRPPRSCAGGRSNALWSPWSGATRRTR